jgi:hypothetical protein
MSALQYMHPVLDVLAAQVCFRGACRFMRASTFGQERLQLDARSLITDFLSALYPSSVVMGTTWRL